MKALLKRSKKEVEIIQWCNDWFSIEVDGKPKIVSPTALLFRLKDVYKMLKHKNNGMLFNLFEVKHTVAKGSYFVTFKKIKTS